MEFASVYHKTSEQMSYALDENQLVVNIKTGYDVKKIFIHYGDPFDAGILGGNEKWTGKREEIVYKKRLSHQIWWTTTLLPRTPIQTYVETVFCIAVREYKVLRTGGNRHANSMSLLKAVGNLRREDCQRNYLARI